METAHLLRAHQLRTTTSREAILALFAGHAHALSYADIEQALGDTHDRVTVYRTLKTFVDKGVIHKVLDDSGSLKYALCKDECNAKAHHHNHVHFKCTGCGQTLCLADVDVPPVRLPKGYQIGEINLLVQGVCQKCSN